MKFAVITLFPEMVLSPLSQSMVGKAKEKGLIDIEAVDLRLFCEDKHRTADDAPFGGGGGMVMKAEPVLRAARKCKAEMPGARVIYLSPQAKPLNHETVMRLSKEQGLILLCGHYEGIDQRALDSVVDEELSLGDYVLTGGELAAAVVIDAISRQLPGVLGDDTSAANDSFYNGLLDYPHYTRPASLPEGEVPKALLSGNHEEIRKWRREQSLLATQAKRPDLLEKAGLSEEDQQFLKKTRGQS